MRPSLPPSISPFWDKSFRVRRYTADGCSKGLRTTIVGEWRRVKYLSFYCVLKEMSTTSIPPYSIITRIQEIWRGKVGGLWIWHLLPPSFCLAIQVAVCKASFTIPSALLCPCSSSSKASTPHIHIYISPPTPQIMTFIPLIVVVIVTVVVEKKKIDQSPDNQ